MMLEQSLWLALAILTLGRLIQLITHRIRVRARIRRRLAQ